MEDLCHSFQFANGYAVLSLNNPFGEIESAFDSNGFAGETIGLFRVTGDVSGNRLVSQRGQFLAQCFDLLVHNCRFV